MAGITDLIEIFRGENLDYNPFKKAKGTVGRFVTDSIEYANAAANKFPAIIKSADIPKKTLKKSMEAFDQSLQPTSNLGSRYKLGLLDEVDKSKLKINILKTLKVNIKNLTPLAMKGLSAMANLPIATVSMILQATPANADEANMQLEDFAKLAKENNVQMGSMDKTIETKQKDI
tara:strand:+ start:40 stop:564 length:525 start_codon:yes stop_codon:yes gene_type:complete